MSLSRDTLGLWWERVQLIGQSPPQDTLPHTGDSHGARSASCAFEANTFRIVEYHLDNIAFFRLLTTLMSIC